MSNKQYQPILWFILMSLMLVAVLLLSDLLAPSVSQADDLPDRDDPPPSAPSNDDGDGDGDGDGGGGGGSSLLAYLELFVSPTPVGVEGVVQWQDVNGNWNDVGGWKRNLQNGYERWTVEAKDFNTGPFRWVVRNSQSEVVVGPSESFNLPAGANETLQVTMTLQ